MEAHDGSVAADVVVLEGIMLGRAGGGHTCDERNQ
jgi:hypothetical protein